MKFLVIACLSCLALAQGPPQGPFVRDIKADELRDYPGLCYSSTNLNFFLPGMSWPLFPFCGVAECVEEGGQLIERVRDCGPQPKPNKDCVVANLAALQSNETILEYPECCPVHQCPEGVTLEYPTPEEIQAQIEEQRVAAVASIKQGAAERAAAAAAQPSA